MATRSETRVTALHPAAVEAIDKINDPLPFTLFGKERNRVEYIISEAIDDHLKSEGWEELYSAASRASSWCRKCDLCIEHKDRILEALRQVKP